MELYLNTNYTLFVFLKQKRNLSSTKSPVEWLNTVVKQEEDNGNPNKLNLPKMKTTDGFRDYEIDYLYDDQKKFIAEILGKIKEWMECKDLSNFKPLRLTDRGSGGSGKSEVKNTLVSILRRMYKYDGVVRVAAPTGTAALKVGGETLYHLTESKVTKQEYNPN